MAKRKELSSLLLCLAGIVVFFKSKDGAKRG